MSTKNAAGEILSKDALGVTGDQVWTFAKSGKGFSTVQMINMMGINAGWHNEEGYADNKTPDAQENLTVRLSLAGKTAQEAAKIVNQVYVTSPDDWATSSMKKAQASLETDDNGQPVLVISVPKLTLWNMLYIKEDTTATPVEPVILKPVTNQAGKKADNTVTSEASSETAKSENTTVNKDSEVSTDVKPIVEHAQPDETMQPAPSVDTLIKSAAIPVSMESETPFDGKDGDLVSNSGQGAPESASVNTLASEALSLATSEVSSDISESARVSSATSVNTRDSASSISESEPASSAMVSESAIATTTAMSESHVVAEPVFSLTESESQATTSLASETSSTVSLVASSEVSESEPVSTKVSETETIIETSTSENSTSTVVSESHVVVEPVLSLTESESQVSPSEVASATSETVSTSEEVLLGGLSENINSWNRFPDSPRVSESLPSTSETITEAASLFSNYARYSETASSEVHSMVVASSEASIEKLAVSILKDTEDGLYDARTIRNIVEMIDSITTNVRYTHGTLQEVANTDSSDNTYSGSQNLNIANKTTTQKGDKGTTEGLKETIVKTAKSHKWGEHAVAILTAIVLAGAAALAALRNFLMSKKDNK